MNTFQTLLTYLSVAFLSLPCAADAQFISHGSTFRSVSAEGITNHFNSTDSSGLYTQEAIDTDSWGYALGLQTTIVSENSIIGSCYANVSSNGTNVLGDFSYVDGYASSQLETTFTIAEDTPYALFGVDVYNNNGRSDGLYNGWGAGGIRPAGTGSNCGCYLCAIPYDLGSSTFSKYGVLHSGAYTFNLDAGDLTMTGYHDTYAEYNWSIVFTFATAPTLFTSFVTNGPVIAGLAFQWPSVFTNFVLEATSDANLVGGWSPVTNDVSVQGEMATVVVDTTSPRRFFRMRHL